MEARLANETRRDLTNLEYAVLGLISVEPQSGYSIITYFESYWSDIATSPGSIYPILKRLEQQDIIAGEVELVQEARSRKMYTLTPQGEGVLHAWLKAPISKDDAGRERPIMMLKFLFMEKHLARQDVIAWLDDYEKATDYYLQLLTLSRSPELQVWSLHQHLILEATMMELNMQRTWIQMARRRLQTEI